MSEGKTEDHTFLCQSLPDICQGGAELVKHGSGLRIAAEVFQRVLKFLRQYLVVSHLKCTLQKVIESDNNTTHLIIMSNIFNRDIRTTRAPDRQGR